MNRTLPSKRPQASPTRPRRVGPALAVESLEERWLLDGQVSVGMLGGPIVRDLGLDRMVPYSVIALGSAMTVVTLFGPPGGSPGVPPPGKLTALPQSGASSPVQVALPNDPVGNLAPVTVPQLTPAADPAGDVIQDLGVGLLPEEWLMP